MPADGSISPDFPFASQFVDVHGSRMHYVQEGTGDPVLFLHGNPTSSYLWRNIIPHVSPHGRCIAPDLIGMGRSDKPDIDYRFLDHYRYIEGFIDALELDRITLVVHDWGSGLGFHFARQHPERIRGIAFMEAIYRPMSWSDLPAGFGVIFRLFRAPLLGELINGRLNVFVNRVIPMSVVRDLTDEEMDHYRAPFPTYDSRRPVWQWPREIPLGGSPPDVHAIVRDYNTWLQETEIPKLLLYPDDGGLITADDVAWCEEHLPHLDTVHIGPGIHYVQEDNPHGIGEAVADWLQRLA